MTERKLRKLEKDYLAFREQQAQLEDPCLRLEVRGGREERREGDRERGREIEMGWEEGGEGREGVD